LPARWPAFWIPAYLLAVLHAGLILRRDLSIRFAWSVVPIIPILLLLGVELRARTLFREAEFLFDQREYARAAELFERAVAVPTRSSKAVVLVHLGHCRMHIGDLTGAEDAMLRACADRESGVWASYMLGAFYINNRTRGTSYFQPSKAVGLFAKVIQESDDATLRRYAEQHGEYSASPRTGRRSPRLYKQGTDEDPSVKPNLGRDGPFEVGEDLGGWTAVHVHERAADDRMVEQQRAEDGRGDGQVEPWGPTST